MDDRFPCLAYIIRQLGIQYAGRMSDRTSDNKEHSTVSFLKFYVLLLTAAGKTSQEIADELIFLATWNGIALNTDRWGDPGSSDAVSKILADDGVAIYKYCKQYYAKFDAHHSACPLCPYNKGGYSNFNKLSEASLLQYCLGSRQQFESVAAFGVLSNHFFFMDNLTEGKATARKIVPIYPFRYIYTALSSAAYPVGFTEGDPFFDTVHSMIVADFEKQRAVIQKGCSVPLESFVSSTLSRTFKFLNDAKDMHISIPSLCEIISKQKGPDADTRGVALAKGSNLGDDAVEGAYKGRKRDTGNKSHKGMPERLNADAVASQSDLDVKDKGTAGGDGPRKVVNITMDMLMSYDGNDLAESSPTRKKPDVELSAEKRIDIEDAVSAEQSSEARLLPVPVSYTQSDTPSVFGEHLAQGDYVDSEDSDAYRDCVDLAYAEVSGAVDMVAVPRVDFCELYHYSVCLDNDYKMLTILEERTIKDKRLCIEYVEVVHEDSATTGVYLLYSPSMHCYLYTTMTDRACIEVITMLLSYPSITKLCYMPYYLLSNLRSIGVGVHGLVALSSILSHFRRGEAVSMEDALLSMKCIPAVPGVHVRCVWDEVMLHSTVLLYMHSYFKAYMRADRLLTRAGWRQMSLCQNKFDCALALSYRRSLFSNSDDSLFSMRMLGFYRFNNQIPVSYRSDGKAVCLYIEHSPEPLQDTLRYLIYELYDRDVFFKHNIYLLYIGDCFLTYYVPCRDEERVTLLVNRLLVRRMKSISSGEFSYRLLPADKALCPVEY